MFRTFLSLVLVPILALPHGMCFCHYIEAAPLPQDPSCTHELPATPPESPDDHDADCPCKLREVSTLHAGSIEVVRDLDLVLSVCDAESMPSTPDVTSHPETSHPRANHEPVALILCALRI
jgi:hypothetical protein